MHIVGHFHTYILHEVCSENVLKENQKQNTGVKEIVSTMPCSFLLRGCRYDACYLDLS